MPFGAVPEVLLDVALALLWIGGGILLALAVPAVVRRLIRPDASEAGPDGYRHSLATRDLSQTVGFRVAALYGVILALVYAQELSGFNDVRSGFAEEAVRVADVWHDAGRHGGPSAPVIRTAMRDYVEIVSGPEWELLGTERRLSEEGWAARDRAYQAALNLQPANLREARLRDQMLDRLTDIARFRQLRGEVAHTRSGGVFWSPAIAGLALVSIPFFVFAPTRANRLLISSFGAFSGLILFLIAAFSNPFSHPFRVAPDPFTTLLATDLKAAP